MLRSPDRRDQWAEVELVCHKHGLDPVTSGWIAPRPPAKVGKPGATTLHVEEEGPISSVCS